MPSFKQEIYNEMTGETGYRKNTMLEFQSISKLKKIELIKETAKLLIQEDQKYAGNQKPYRYEISDQEARQICNILEGKKRWIYANQAYESLK